MICHLLFKVLSVLSSVYVGHEWVYVQVYVPTSVHCFHCQNFGAHNRLVPLALCLACMTRMDTVRLWVPNQVAVVNCLAACSWSGKKVFHLPEWKSCTRTLGVRRPVTCRHKKNTAEKKTENLESFPLIVLEAPVLLNRL